ncbi:alpha/beta fold hydrolase [Kineococcus sp. R8]|nr:alpha/beta fold hydrolase [Kineococcus siccus]
MAQATAGTGPALRERSLPSRRWELDGESLNVEVHDPGHHHLVVLEAGLGNCRTSWDVLVPHLLDRPGSAVTVVTYDRPGSGRSPASHQATTIKAMAHRLATFVHHAVTDTVDTTGTAGVDGDGGGRAVRIVLVGHSLGGLLVRCALPLLTQQGLGQHVAGIVLLDPTTETADAYADPNYYRQFGRLLALQQHLARVAPLRRWATTARRRALPAATGEAMIAEDFTPASLAQARREHLALRDAVPSLRTAPPAPPTCPVIVLSAGHATKAAAPFRADVVAHQRAYAESLPSGQFESLPAGHFLHVEQAPTVAAAIRELLA